MFMALAGSYRDIALTPEEIAEIIANLPEDLSEERRQVVLTAYQLEGKVNYFWGGKYLDAGLGFSLGNAAGGMGGRQR